MHEFIRHLKADHDKQRGLSKRLKTATDPQERTSLRQELHDEVVPHMAGEEASIFPYMQKSEDAYAREHALEAVQEHHAGRLIMRELLELSPDSEIFKAKASVLGEMNEHHMAEEENTHFPWLEQHVSKERLDALYKEYEAAEEAEK